MSCAQQRSNRSCHRYRWASACGHSVAWGWDAAAWEWDAAWEAAAARHACRTGAGCTDVVVDQKKNPAKVGPWRGLRRAAQRGGLSRASSGACHANPQKRLCPVTGKATRRKFRSGVAFSAQSRPRFSHPQRRSRTKANWAESPSPASAMRITSSRRNRPSRLLPGSSGKYSWVVSTGCCGA